LGVRREGFPSYLKLRKVDHDAQLVVEGNGIPKVHSLQVGILIEKSLVQVKNCILLKTNGSRDSCEFNSI